MAEGLKGLPCSPVHDRVPLRPEDGEQGRTGARLHAVEGFDPGQRGSVALRPQRRSDRAHRVFRVIRQEVAHAPRALPSVDAFDVVVGRPGLAEEVLHARRIVVAVLGRPSLDPTLRDPWIPRRHGSRPTRRPGSVGRGGFGMSVAIALGGLAAGHLLERLLDAGRARWIVDGDAGSVDPSGGGRCRVVEGSRDDRHEDDERDEDHHDGRHPPGPARVRRPRPWSAS